mgnify:CR=1 FL=1
MLRTSNLHFRSKVPRKAFVFSLIGSFIWLSSLPQVALSDEPSPQNGKKVYQTYCIACHTIGGGRLSGPDLKGVTSKREQSWLVRWIVEPDKMLAEGDKIATELKQEYNNIPMPNFGLSPAQAKDILAYIEVTESGVQEIVEPKPSFPPVVIPAVIAPATQSPEQGQKIFQEKCSACHTIGSGIKVGPDLKGAVSRRDYTWLIHWITDPSRMQAEGDPIALQLMQEHNNFPMPNYALSQAQAKDIIAYLAAESGEAELLAEKMKAEGFAKKPEPTSPEKPKLSGNPAIGEALFLGKEAFANGGPACIACHSTSKVSGLGGGTLGPDLTKVYSRFGGEMGLRPVLVSLPFPTMQGVFSKKPVLDWEADHLKAYFAQTDSMAEKPSMDFTIIMISIVGFIILYILIHLIWRKRLMGVRIPLVGR